MKKLSHFTAGFSLVEILLYFTLAGAVLAAALSFVLQITTLNMLSRNIQEISYSSNELFKNIQTAMFEAKSIDDTLSLWDTDQGALALKMADAAVSPTRFYLENANAMMQQGVQDAVRLNTDFTTVDALRFHKITSYKNPDQVIIDAVVRNTNQDFKQQNHSTAMHLTLALRNL